MTLDSSRLGYVYRHDDRHYTQDDLRMWLPILEALDAHWLTLVASSERTIPEAFLTGILGAGIEPIILVRSKIGEANFNTMQPLLRSYARWGVHHVAVFDRPNLRCNWMVGEWNQKGIVDRFLDHTIPLLEFQQSVGLTPVFAPLEPGGDYWDTAFLHSALEALTYRVKSDLLDNLFLGVYSWTYAKPLDWGSGGQSRWPEARPYSTPPNCQDQIGFRTFEWHAEIAKQTLGRIPPMLVFAGGAIPDPTIGKRHSRAQTDQNVSILRMLNDLPNYVRNFSFDCLTAEATSPSWNAAWFEDSGTPTPIVEAIQKVLHSQEKTPFRSTSKPLSHYVLLPNAKELERAIPELTAYIQTYKPILGFSETEARMAQKVTLVGEEKDFSQNLEQELVDSGCMVDRIMTGNRAGDNIRSVHPHTAIRYSPLGGSKCLNNRTTSDV